MARLQTARRRSSPCFEAVPKRYRIGWGTLFECRGVDQADIRANQISHCVNGIFTWEPRPTLANSRIRSNIVAQCLDLGIDLRRDSSNVVIEWNRVSFCGVSHIGLLDGTSRSIARYNIVCSGGYYSETMQFPGSSAINLNAAADGCIVEFNLAANQVDLTEIDGNGIIVDLSQAGSKSIVRGNLCLANMGSGLNTTASPNTAIYGNACCRNGLDGRAPRNGAGIKLWRNELVNWNCYVTEFAPIAWDGDEASERAYYQLLDLRSATGWETEGIRLP